MFVSVNGNYGFWSAWSDCDKTCGGGRRIRSRSCTNPPPQFGGSDCNMLGPLQQSEICNLNKCPVHGNYSNWSLWSPCSVTCGVGTVERQRYCTNPPPSPNGRNCDDQGPSTEKKSCELVECTGKLLFITAYFIYWFKRNILSKYGWTAGWHCMMQTTCLKTGACLTLSISSSINLQSVRLCQLLSR